MDVLGLFRLENDRKKVPELPVVVLTVVCYAVSILLLSTHLIVFSFTHTMWTTKGKNLAAFCISTILGFCAYISSVVMKNDHKVYAVGIVFTYYCSLTHSSWLLTMSFECWRTCMKSETQKAYESERSWVFVWYSLFAWIQPAIFVGLALCAEFFDVPPTILPRFLKPSFVTQPEDGFFKPTLAFVLFFVVPLAFNLLVNAVLLLRTNCLIRRLVECDAVCSPQNIELAWEFKLYSRLNLLITLTWLANVLDALVTRSLICNIFVISLSVVQALYILLVFTFNNNISTLMHYKNEELNLNTFVNKKADLGDTWGGSVVV